VCTVDLRRGVQAGELVQVTPDGAVTMHGFPRGLRRID
jgi:hypothetical protein